MTRYPKAGKGSRWTVRELDSISAQWKGDTLNDGGGLFGEVRSRKSGATSIRFKYIFRRDKKILWHQCGTYPDNSIAEIRAERDRARQQVAEGINPTDAKKAAKIQQQAAIEATLAEEARQRAEYLTVADLFEQWLQDGVSREDGNAELRRSFNKDVLPVVGKIPLRNLTDRHLLDMLRKVKERGLNRTVVSLSRDFGQMLRWAEKRKPWRALLVDGNPADLVDVSQLLDLDYQEERDRVLCEDEIQELHRRFTQLEQGYAALPAGKSIAAPALFLPAYSARSGYVLPHCAGSASCFKPNGDTWTCRQACGGFLPPIPRGARASDKTITSSFLRLRYGSLNVCA